MGNRLPWIELETAFADLYSHKGRGAKLIRLMCGLSILKQLYNLSDESVIIQWRINPCCQMFCGETSVVREVKDLRLACRHFHQVKRRAKAKKALKRLRTIAGALRESRRTLQKSVLARESVRFGLYEKVLTEPPKDKNKIYCLHEPAMCWER